MTAESAPPSHRLRRVAQLALLMSLTSACAEEAAPAPAPVPQDFDDPFAEEAKAGAVAEVAEAVPGDRSAGAVAEASAATAGVAAGASGAAGEAGASAAAVVGEGAGEAAAAAGVVSAGAAGAAGEAAGFSSAAAATASTKREGKKAAPTPKPETPAPAPVPADSPAPAPAPTPVPEPAAPAPVEKPAAPAVPPQQRFVGTFRFAGGEAQRQNLEAAIEAAAEQLNALIRGIGRKRLRESNPIREQITIAVDGDKVSMTFGPGRTLTGRIDGPAVAWTSDSGKPVQVSLGLVKGRLVQTFTAEDGGRRSVYTLDEAGDRMTLSVTITSERLANPLKYALTYKRG